jgi:hypothetical protein
MSDERHDRPRDLATEHRPLIPLWPDAGRYLDLKRTATYAAAERGEIPTVKIGGRKRAVTAKLKEKVGII